MARSQKALVKLVKEFCKENQSTKSSRFKGEETEREDSFRKDFMMLPKETQRNILQNKQNTENHGTVLHTCSASHTGNLINHLNV